MKQENFRERAAKFEPTPKWDPAPRGPDVPCDRFSYCTSVLYKFYTLKKISSYSYTWKCTIIPWTFYRGLPHFFLYFTFFIHCICFSCLWLLSYYLCYFGLYIYKLTCSDPPVCGFKPKIHARCWRVTRIVYHELANISPLVNDNRSNALIHCKFLAVSITGPSWAPKGIDNVGNGVPTYIK